MTTVTHRTAPAHVSCIPVSVVVNVKVSLNFAHKQGSCYSTEKLHLSERVQQIT